LHSAGAKLVSLVDEVNCAQDVAEVPYRVNRQPYAALQYKRRANGPGTPETVANRFLRFRLNYARKRRRITDRDQTGFCRGGLAGNMGRSCWSGPKLEDRLCRHDGKLPPGGLLSRPLQDLKTTACLADKTILPLSVLELCDLYHSIMFQGTAIFCGKRGTKVRATLKVSECTRDGSLEGAG
jgi:hypothetical protein